MTCWIIYAKESVRDGKDNAFDWMIESAAKNGVEASVYLSEYFEVSNQNLIYNDEVKAVLPETVLMRTYNFELGRYFESKGVKVFNDMKALEDCQDKWMTYLILKEKSIPTIETLMGDYDFAELVDELDLPFVMKDRYGSKGEGVLLIKDQNEWKDGCDVIEHPIYQPFLPCDNSDIRVHVIDEKAVAWVKRFNPNDFRSNFSQGGSAVAFEASEDLLHLAIEGVKAIGLDIGGIDILNVNGCWLICEVNGISGFRTIFSIGGPSIPDLIFRMIGGKCENS